MKRIEFIAPVEAMRGNLGSNQELEYGANGESAFDSAANHTNYAKNYQPRFIGAKVSRTGLKYFAVKVKSAVKTTAAWLLQCALMGATAAIYAFAVKDAALKVSLHAEYVAAGLAGYKGTFHKWLTNAIRLSLAAKASTITVSGPNRTITLGNNPFSTADSAIEISKELLVKFWKQLCPDAITFTVAGMKGIAISGMEVLDVVGMSRINVLGISSTTIATSVYAVMDGRYIIDNNGDYVGERYTLTDGAVFTLTEVAPEA